jgi:putative aldouronate transport system substrate-binding protein
MKILKKAAMVLTTALLTMTVLSCGGQGRGGTSGKGGVTQAPREVDWSEHETFTIWQQADTNEFYSGYGENPVIWALNKKFNVTLQFEHPVQGTEADAMSLMFGTGEYTDMIPITYYNGSVNQLYEDGVIIDIAEYLDYMPNYKRLLENEEGYRRISYNEDGKILQLRGIYAPGRYETFCWGGLMYRRDILETMTGGNVRFPSGGEYPTTIGDWEYVLPLFKSYFESTGAVEYAPLILPYNGYFAYGELLNSFGVAASGEYIKNGIVKNGFYEGDALYKYLKKMREWYDKGWIYKDFASRTNDVFYFPNPALTYGGTAGIWFGFAAQLGDAMSMPQYGMIFDVRAVPSPLSTADGITEFANFMIGEPYPPIGYVFSTKCKNLPKLLSIIDYNFSEEGGLMFSSGLSKEDGAGENPVLIKAGLADGMYWYEGDELVVNPAVRNLNRDEFVATRLPGLWFSHVQLPDILERDRANTKVWNPSPDTKIQPLPSGISYSSEEESTLSGINVQITDYINSTIPKFIMGTLPLNDRAWADFKAQLKALGIDDTLRIRQAAYDRYLKR